MSDGGTSQPAGWYYAQGDPPGTQRYWDGSQWVGGPQAAQGSPEPAGFGQFGAAGYGGSATPAEWVTRLLAYLIDAGIMFVGYIVVTIVANIIGAASSSLGTIVGLVGTLALLGFWVWNFVILQGGSGQTIGKQRMGIKLIADSTGQPVGAGMAFVRYLVGSLISAITCGIAGLLDVLWPLWDAEKKRLTDKILNFSVVTA